MCSLHGTAMVRRGRWIHDSVISRVPLPTVPLSRSLDTFLYLCHQTSALEELSYRIEKAPCVVQLSVMQHCAVR